MTRIYLSFLIALACVVNLNAEEPEFTSKLFKDATLVYSDEFDGGKYKGRYGHHKAKKKVEDGKLVIYPLDPNTTAQIPLKILQPLSRCLL